MEFKIGKLQAQKLVAVFLLTDGYLKYRRSRKQYILQVYSNDDRFHNYFIELMRIAFEREKPTFSNFYKGRRVRITGYETKENSEIIETLLSFCSTYKTKIKTNINLEFLSTEPKYIKQLAFRIGMSADGSIGVSKHKNNKEDPRLRLACAHPNLVRCWRKLAKSINITMQIDRDSSTWSGIHGLYTGSKENILSFHKMGGFYPDVSISQGRFKGFTKNELLSAISLWYNDNKIKTINKYI